MYISSRMIKVIEYLMEKDVATLKEIANNCNSSDRKVRYDIESLNFLLRMNNLEEIEKLPKGVLKIPKGFSKSKKVKEFKNLNKYSKEDRIEYIKAKMLIEGRINLSAIAKELDISRTSIRKDLGDVILQIENEFIKVNNNEIIADERRIRHHISKKFSKDIMKFQSELDYETNLNLVDGYLDDLIVEINQKKLRKVIENIAKDMGNENINYFTPVWIYIIIAFIRIKAGNIRDGLKEDEIIKDKLAYKVAVKYKKDLENILGIEYSGTEVDGLARCIEGCMTNNINSYIYENWVDIVLIIENIINDASEYSKINLKNDEELINGLMNHIKPAIYRMIKNIKLEIDICMDVIEPYRELIEIVRDNLRGLEKNMEIEVTDSEVVLLTLHLVASIERNKKIANTEKNILLVCGGGYGTTSIVADMIKRNYKVNIVDMISYSNYKHYEMKNIDFIVTILNINEDEVKGKKIIKISPFISAKDKEVLSEFLPKQTFNKQNLNRILDIINYSELIKNKEELVNNLEGILNGEKNDKKVAKTLKDYIEIDKISVIDKVYSWQEGVARAGELLEKYGDINKRYTENIITVSEKCGIYYILKNGIVIPHGEVSEYVNNSAIGVLYLKEPITFSCGRKGRLFFMIAAKTTKDHVKSIEEINRLSLNSEFINELNDIKSKDDLMELIIKNVE